MNKLAVFQNNLFAGQKLKKYLDTMGDSQSKSNSIKKKKKQNKEELEELEPEFKMHQFDVLLNIHNDQKQKITIENYSQLDYLKSENALSLSIDSPMRANITSFPSKNMDKICKLVERSQKLNFLRLNIFSWRIGNIGITKLAKSISKIQSLTHLDLNYQYNSVNLDGTLLFAQDLSKCLNLQHLNLAICQSIDDNTLLQLGKALSLLTKLETLILDFGEHPTIDIVIFDGMEITQIYDSGLIRFFKCLKFCQNLNFIQLYFDDMVPVDQTSLKKIILKFKRLTFLNFSWFEQNKYFKRY